MDDEEEPPLLLPSESKSLLGRTAFTPPVAPPDNSRRRRLYTLGAFVTVFGVGLLGRASVTVVPKQNALLAEDTFTFTSTNEFGSDLPGGGHYPGMAFFAEPYKKTGLDVSYSLHACLVVRAGHGFCTLKIFALRALTTV